MDADKNKIMLSCSYRRALAFIRGRLCEGPTFADRRLQILVRIRIISNPHLHRVVLDLAFYPQNVVFDLNVDVVPVNARHLQHEGQSLCRLENIRGWHIVTARDRLFLLLCQPELRKNVARYHQSKLYTRRTRLHRTRTSLLCSRARCEAPTVRGDRAVPRRLCGCR